jgi:hypothetical protein
MKHFYPQLTLTDQLVKPAPREMNVAIVDMIFQEERALADDFFTFSERKIKRKK